MPVSYGAVVLLGLCVVFLPLSDEIEMLNKQGLLFLWTRCHVVKGSRDIGNHMAELAPSMVQHHDAAFIARAQVLGGASYFNYRSK